MTTENTGFLVEPFDRFYKDMTQRLKEKGSKRVDVKIVTSKASFTSDAWSGIDFELVYDTVGTFVLNENPEKEIIVGVKYDKESKKIVFCFRDNYEPSDTEKTAFEEIVAIYIEEYIKKGESDDDKTI